MNVNLTDKEIQVCNVAIYELILLKSGSLNSPKSLLTHFTNQKLNEHDILSSGHTLAAAITAFEKLSGRKILQPSQNAPR